MFHRSEIFLELKVKIDSVKYIIKEKTEKQSVEQQKLRQELLKIINQCDEGPHEAKRAKFEINSRNLLDIPYRELNVDQFIEQSTYLIFGDGVNSDLCFLDVPCDSGAPKAGVLPSHKVELLLCEYECGFPWLVVIFAAIVALRKPENFSLAYVKNQLSLITRNLREKYHSVSGSQNECAESDDNDETIG